MPPREAQLARGFVLGEDEAIDAATVEDFRRSGLSHLLAVSGQNVALLALLAMPVLAALGIPLRTRLVWVLGLIAVYVPLAGAGPSIQRAGVMGALSVVATLAGRRASRFFALAFAAAAMLALEPGIAADVGWQLSFAAVLGILLLAAPLREAIVARIGGSGWRRALAEGAAMTIAATLATAPLIAFHFEAISTTTLIANLLALPAVAPAMWLGMLAAAAGQVPGFPVAALNALDAPLLAYIAQVAAWCGRPSWAYAPPADRHRRPGRLLCGDRGRRPSAALRLGRKRRIAAAPQPHGPHGPISRRRGRAFGPSAGGARRAMAVLAAVGGCAGAVESPRWRRRGRAADGPARLGPRHRPGRRDPAAAGAARRRCWSTAARPATGSPRSCVPPGSNGSAPRSSPTTSPTTPAGSANCSGRCRSAGSLYAVLRRPTLAEARAAGAAPLRLARGQRAARRAPAARRPLAAARAARRTAPAARTRTGWRW